MSVQFAPMTEEHYVKYLAKAVNYYADDKVKAGTWDEEEALEKSRDEFAALLPQGIHSKNHLLFSVENNGKPIGILWLYIIQHGTEKHAFIYDIELDEAERGKGLGKATMEALDEYAKREGIKKIMLHVFAHNHRAISLYEKCGYEMTDYHMAKRY